jgi:hypothetical protein
MSTKNEQLKKEWMSHTREAIEKKWYKCELSSGLYDGVWREITCPEFLCAADYRIVKTSNHPEYVEPPKMVKVEFETTKYAAIELFNYYVSIAPLLAPGSDSESSVKSMIDGLRKAAAD